MIQMAASISVMWILLIQNITYIRTKLEVSECASVNDEYEGVAFINENTLTVQIANKKYALFYAFEKTQ